VSAGGGAGGGGGTSATGGGGSSSGSPGGFVFATMSIPADVPTAVVAISGRAGETYAVTGSRVMHSTGGAFTEIEGLPDTDFVSLYVAPDGTVFMSTYLSLAVCHDGCDTAASWAFEAQAPGVTPAGLCGTSSSDVYAVIDTGLGATGGVRHWDGLAWSTLSADIGAHYGTGCTVDGNGDLWVAALGGVAHYSMGGFTIEAPDQSITGPIAMNAVTAVAGWVHAVGASRHIFTRDPQNAWSISHNPPSDPSDLSVVGATAANEVFAAGEYSSKDTTAQMFFNGTTWSVAPDILLLGNVAAMWVASPNEIWLGGEELGGEGTPVIVRGRR
jgi:hypothetical protein